MMLLRADSGREISAPARPLRHKETFKILQFLEKDLQTLAYNGDVFHTFITGTSYLLLLLPPSPLLGRSSLDLLSVDSLREPLCT